jgi:hypothetical protein
VSRKNGPELTGCSYFLTNCHYLYKSPANHENKGDCPWLTWAGTEARPTEEKDFLQKPETGNQKPSRNSELYFLGNCHELHNSPANHENKGDCPWLTWAGTEVRPTKQDPTAGTARPIKGLSRNSKLFLGNQQEHWHEEIF